MRKTNFSRRIFFKGAIAVASLWFFNIWDKLVKTEIAASVKKHWKFPFNRNKEVTFYEEFIVVNGAKETKILSSHCTHLGCLIHDFRDGKFICPCHGSEFSVDGKALKGPAYKPLERIEHHFDEKKEFIFVESKA